MFSISGKESNKPAPTGQDDHYIPFKLHAPLIKSLKNVKSVTDIVFNKNDHADSHCSIRNI